jgi:hypothetical protein
MSFVSHKVGMLGLQHEPRHQVEESIEGKPDPKAKGGDWAEEGRERRVVVRFERSIEELN